MIHEEHFNVNQVFKEESNCEDWKVNVDSPFNKANNRQYETEK